MSYFHAFLTPRRGALLVLFLLACASPTLAAAGPRCRMCGMDATKSQTEFVVHHQDGTQERTCCLHCVHLLQKLSGGPAFQALQTRDFATGAFVDATRAVYLEGSTLIPQGSMAPFLLAFGDRKEAERYQQRYRGTVLDFAQAMEVVARFDEEGEA